MASGTYPCHQVDFAPGVAANVFPSAGDWVEITSKVFEWATDWGSKDEFTQPGPGTGDLLLNNSDGRFDPDNTTGPYYGLLVEGLWFRIRGGTTTASSDVFFGHVSPEGFQVGVSQYSDTVVWVRLVDDAEVLANADLPIDLSEVEILADAPAVWWRLGESSGTQATDSSGNGNHGTYAGGATANSVAALAKNSANAAIAFDGDDDAVSLASFTPGNTFTIEFWIQAEPQDGRPAVLCLLGGGSPYTGQILIREAASSDPRLEYSYTDPATGATTEYQTTAAVFDGERHHVAIKQNGATTNIYVDLFNVGTLTSGAATNITWGPMYVAVATDDFSPLTRHVGTGSFLAATLDEISLFTTALAFARIAVHWVIGVEPWGGLTSTRVGSLLDFVGYSATQRHINTGHSTLDEANLGQDAWSALVEVAKAEGGAVYIDHQDNGKFRFLDRRHRWEAAASVTSQVTIGDGGGAEVPADDIDLADDRIVNVAIMQRARGAAVTVTDGTGRKRTLSETGLLYDNDAESQYRGERVIAEKKDRHRRVRSVTLEPRKSTHPAWAHVFARKVNDRVTAKWRPTYGGTRSYDAWIIGIGQRWNHKTGLRTIFYLARVPFDTTAEPYWILGTSAAGVTTRPGY